MAITANTTTAIDGRDSDKIPASKEKSVKRRRRYPIVSPLSTVFSEPTEKSGSPCSGFASSNGSTGSGGPPLSASSTIQSSRRQFSTTSGEFSTFPVKIRANSTSLSSGFPYHPALFDLRVPPGDWASFTSEVVKSTKLTFGDRVAVAAIVAGIGVTGMVGTAIYSGRKFQDRFQVKRVRTALDDPKGLGYTLSSWNEHFFAKLGLEAQVEVSEAALRNEAERNGDDEMLETLRRRRTIEKTPLVYLRKETRDRRAEERKFSIVLRPVSEAAELPAGDFERRAEMDSAEVAEMSAGSERAEMPAYSAGQHEKSQLLPENVSVAAPIELDSTEVRT
jgi:Domain of unknown function (DUF4646)